MQLVQFLTVFLCLCFCFSCDEDKIFEEHHNFETYHWAKNDIVSLEPEIRDTIQRYDIIFNVRHTNNYYNNNLWVRIETVYPSGKSQQDVVEIPMAAADGRWYGSGSGNIISNEVQIQAGARFPEKGKYKLLIEQYMRMDTLSEIINVGIRLQEAATN